MQPLSYLITMALHPVCALHRVVDRLRNVLSYSLLGLALVLTLGALQPAYAQVIFSELAISPPGGTVPIGGKLAVKFTGHARSEGDVDAVKTIYLFDNNVAVGTAVYPVSYNPRTETPRNTPRDINFSVDLSPGVHALQLVAEREIGSPGASPVYTIAITTPTPVNGAKFISQNVRASMVAGQSYNVSITMQNTGNTTWTSGGANPYRLGSQNPENNVNWGLNRVELPHAVAPGETATFNFTVRAPSTQATYGFRWDMVWEGQEWFRTPTDNLDIPVRLPAGDPEPVFHSPANGSDHLASGGYATVTFVGSATPGINATLTRLEMLENGMEFASTSLTSLVGSKPLSVGMHTVELRAYNNAGLSASTSITVRVVNGQPPVVSFKAPIGDSTVVRDGDAAVSIVGEAAANGGGTLTAVDLLDNGTVVRSFGGVSRFAGTVNLPQGVHKLQLRATDSIGGQGFSGINTVTVVAPTSGVNAKFVSQEVPEKMTAGHPYRVTVRMLNTGTAMWTDGQKFRLGSQNPKDNRTWEGRAFLTQNVATGETAVFTFEVTAPYRPDNYNFQWQMVKEDDVWFGEQSKNVLVTVGPAVGPTVTLSATPTNVRVSGMQMATIRFTGLGSSNGATVRKLELFRHDGRAFSMTPVLTLTGNDSSLVLNDTLSTYWGTYKFKLRATDSNGESTDSKPVVVNITNSVLQGEVSGVRSNSAGKPELFGWVCEPGNAEALAYKVLLDAPYADVGGEVLLQGVANVATEADNAAIQGKCSTPGAAHHFVVDLSPHIAAYAGRSLYVYAETANRVSKVNLPCADNSCTMPGTIRIGMTTPVTGDRVAYGQPVFMKMKIGNASGEPDEVGFYLDEQWIPAQKDGLPGEYSASLSGVEARTPPHAVYAKVRYGNASILSMTSMFYVISAEAMIVRITNPISGANIPKGIVQVLRASGGVGAQSVKFFVNGVALGGTATGGDGNWSQNWTPAISGNYTLLARAFDGNGVQLSQSDPINVTVTDVPTDGTPVPIVVNVEQERNPGGGTLPGSVAVANTGHASYRIPLTLPPGILGMVPQLSLNYEGNEPGGVAGLGWSIGGISRIEVCGKTIANDGITDAVRLQGSGDRLCLDGQRLVLSNGNPAVDQQYWADSAVYRTESESFARVTAQSSGGRRWFKVETKDGRIASYGETIDSVATPAGLSNAYRWYLSSVSDRSGNYISYAYNRDAGAGETTPGTISWGGNSARNTPHFAKVVFSYETRPDPRTSYLAGGQLSQNLRLQKIQTSVDASDNGQGSWTNALSYSLAYGTSPSSGRSLLTSVTACDTAGCLPATTFRWGEPQSGARTFAPLGGIRNGPNMQGLALQHLAFADFNGDGKMDILEKVTNGSGRPDQMLYLSNADGTDWTAVRPLAVGPGMPVVKEVADFDGDGLPDLLVVNSDGWRLCLGARRVGLAYSCDVPVSLPADGLGDDTYFRLRIARDFNADGKDDLFLRSNADPNGHIAYECLSTGSGFNCTRVWGGSEKSFGDNDGDARGISGTMATDVDGDGRIDRIILGRCANYVADGERLPKWHCTVGSSETTGAMAVYPEPEQGGPIFQIGPWDSFPDKQTSPMPPGLGGTLTADLNADGYSDMVYGRVKQDITGKAIGFSARVCYSMGGGGACRDAPVSNQVGGVNRDHLLLTMGDFDGDGVPDILRPTNDAWNETNITGYQVCHIGSNRNLGGDPLYQTCEQWSGPTYYTPSQHVLFDLAGSFEPYNRAPYSLILGDFNGDGKPDILTYLGDGKWQIHAAANQARPGEALDRLVAVTNGIGNTERVEYALPNDASVYSSTVARPAGDNTVGKLIYPGHPLVKAVHRDNGLAGSRDTSYRYYRMALDSGGRGNLGFAQIDTIDQQRGTTSTVWPCLAFPYIGSDCASQERSNAGVLLAETTNSWAAKQIVLSGGARTFIPYLASSTVKRRDPYGRDLGRTVTTISDIDNWGNVLATATVSASDANPNGWSVNKAMSYDNDESRWLLGLMRSLTDTRSNDYNTISRKSAYTYTATGLLQSELRDIADNAQRLTTTYERSTAGFGLVSKTILSWTSNAGAAKSRTVSDLDYTPNGRFVRSARNAAGHTEQRTFDARTGTPKSVTSANGLTTYSEADGFGRMLSVTTPDGNIRTSAYKACLGNCPAGATTVTIQSVKRAGGEHSAVPVLQFADNLGRTVRSLSWGFNGSQVITDTVYDALGRVYQQYWPTYAGATSALPGGLLQSQRTYDELDRPLTLKTLSEGGGEANTSYNWVGFTKGIVNAKSQPMREIRDVWGRLNATQDANFKFTAFRFDAFGNLAQTKDAQGNQVIVTYDTWGRRTQLQDPDLGTISYTVDALGQVESQVSPKQRATGYATTMEYDVLGRMTARRSEDLTASWTYDAVGDPASCAVTRSCGQLVASKTTAGPTAIDFLQQHSYDALGRPSATTTTLDVNYSSQTTYDAWGRVLGDIHQRAGGAAKTYERRYNAYGQLQAVLSGGQPVWSATAQDAAGRVTDAQLGNGLLAGWSFDPYSGRPSGSTLRRGGASVLQQGYSYDVLGNVRQRSQSWGGTNAIEDFDYDPVNRLMSATILGQPAQSFSYDSIGNMKSKTGVGSGEYQYPPAGSARPHAVSSIPGIGSFNYDANGNLENGAGRTISWNSFDMPVTITQGTESSTFWYGADHQRVKQRRADGTTFWYAGAMEAEVSGGGALTLRTYLPHGVGVEIEKGSNAQLYYSHRDRLGSVIGLSDQSGNLPEPLAYDSWGKRRDLGTAATPNNIDGVLDNKGYTGHEMLDRLDLVHMNGRVYDPLVARFMSADPIIQQPEHSQSYNRYSYVWNNPTNMTDPTGFMAADDGRVEVLGCAPPNDCRIKDLKQNDTVANAKEGPESKGADSSSQKGKANSSAVKQLGSANIVISNKAPHTLWEDTKEALLINDVQRVYVTAKKLVKDAASYIGGDQKEKQAAGASFQANWKEYVGLGMMLITRGRSSEGALAKSEARALAKPPSGPGSVPKAERDSKRFFTPAEREAKRAEQDHVCANGCGTEIDASNSAGHHIKRHADGGRSVPENHAEVCLDCHTKLHSGD